MSAFDDLLAEHVAPSAADIVLPIRGGTPGTKGGAAGAGTGPASSGGSTPGTGSTPEPKPQLPEGSDDDEVDEAAEAAAGEAEEAARKAAATAQEEEAAAESSRTNDAETPAAEPEPVEAKTEKAPFPVIPRKGPGLVFDGETSHLKQFPRALIEQMRVLLTPHLGAEFARDISQNSIVTALAIAALGVDFKTDENTALAVQAFRANDPRTELLEQRTAKIQQSQDRFEGVLKNLVEKTGTLLDTAAAVELATAYSLAERTAHLVTDGVMPETIDVTQKRVLAARENIRKRTKAQTQLEKEKAGRPIR